jgi:hypothetical protein
MYTDGFYKDDLVDVTHTVDPMPFHAMSIFPYPATESYPTDADHQAYLSEWNTRVVGGPDVPVVPTSTVIATSPAGAYLKTIAGASAQVPTAAAPAATVATPPAVRVAPGASAGVTAPPPAAPPATPIHYSLNTDQTYVAATTYDEAITTANAVAGWSAVSAGATPSMTPSAPGAPATPSQLASTTAADISYWITGDASAEGAYNWQMYQFQLPSSVVSRGRAPVEVDLDRAWRADHRADEPPDHALPMEPDDEPVGPGGQRRVGRQSGHDVRPGRRLPWTRRRA